MLRTDAVEQFKGRRRGARLPDRHERLHVLLGRLNAPSALLPAQEFRPEETVGLIPLHHTVVAIDQFGLAVGSDEGVDHRDDLFAHTRLPALWVIGSSMPTIASRTPIGFENMWRIQRPVRRSSGKKCVSGEELGDFGRPPQAQTLWDSSEARDRPSQIPPQRAYARQEAGRPRRRENSDSLTDMTSG